MGLVLVHHGVGLGLGWTGSRLVMFSREPHRQLGS